MSWSHPAFEALARRIGERTGLAFTADRRPGVESEFRRAMTRARVTDPARFGEWIEANVAAQDDLIAALTVGETYFFREPGQFEFLRRTALPGLREARGGWHEVRAWSAACSTGEEAYSLAILLAQEAPASRALVIGSDISEAALTRARQATYGPWSLRGEGADAARPYLRPVGRRFEVVEPIRQRVVFQRLNLASDAYPSFATGIAGLDLILCRNVLIYLDARTIQAVIERLHESLAVGGWLVTASSDPPLAGRSAFEAVATEQGVFYRRRGPSAPRVAARIGVPSTSNAQTGWPGPRPPGSRTRAESGGAPPAQAPDLPTSDAPIAEILAEAREDLAQGRYARAVERTRALEGDAEADALRIRALANLDPVAADRDGLAATARHPCSTEIHHLRSVVLIALGRDAEAAAAARRVIYLDRSLAIAHFNLGSILRRLGEHDGARRAFRNARDLSAARPADEAIPLADGVRAGRLADLAAAQLARLDAASGGPP